MMYNNPYRILNIWKKCFKVAKQNSYNLYYTILKIFKKFFKNPIHQKQKYPKNYFIYQKYVQNKM